MVVGALHLQHQFDGGKSRGFLNKTEIFSILHYKVFLGLSKNKVGKDIRSFHI